MAVADGSVHDAAVVSRAIARTNPGEQLNWRTARPELVDQPSRVALRRSAVASAKAEGRAECWFDKYILSEALMVRQAHHERRVEGLTTSGRSASAASRRDQRTSLRHFATNRKKQ